MAAGTSRLPFGLFFVANLVPVVLVALGKLDAVGLLVVYWGEYAVFGGLVALYTLAGLRQSGVLIDDLQSWLILGAWHAAMCWTFWNALATFFGFTGDLVPEFWLAVAVFLVTHGSGLLLLAMAFRRGERTGGAFDRPAYTAFLLPLGLVLLMIPVGVAIEFLEEFGKAPAMAFALVAAKSALEAILRWRKSVDF